MNRSKKNKKGFIGDIPIIIIGTIIFSIVAIILLKVVGSFNDTIQTAIEEDIPTEIKEFNQDNTDNYNTAVDNIFIIMAIGLPLISAIMASFLDFSSIYLWIFLILLVLFILAGGVLSIIWDTIINDGAFSGYVSEVPKMALVMNHYPVYCLFVCFIVMMGMFFRIRANQ